jgi:hypothetical protein
MLFEFGVVPQPLWHGPRAVDKPRNGLGFGCLARLFWIVGIPARFPLGDFEVTSW